MFAGIGGFRTGLTNAGDFFMPVGWCEKDKHAQKAYRLLYGTEGEYFCDDARIINPADLPDFDLICGGFPCQPFSVAGQRLGFADERGTLFHEICRLAEARHPKYLLLENVPGLLTHEGGQTFLAIPMPFVLCSEAVQDRFQANRATRSVKTDPKKRRRSLYCPKKVRICAGYTAIS